MAVSQVDLRAKNPRDILIGQNRLIPPKEGLLEIVAVRDRFRRWGRRRGAAIFFAQPPLISSVSTTDRMPV